MTTDSQNPINSIDRPVSAILTATRSRIDTPEKWTTEFYARDANGITRASTDSMACKFCMIGAVLAEYKQGSTMDIPLGWNNPALWMLATALASKVGRRCSPTSIPEFNDSETTTHADVLEVFDAAIAAAKEREAAYEQSMATTDNTTATE